MYAHTRKYVVYTQTQVKDRFVLKLKSCKMSWKVSGGIQIFPETETLLAYSLRGELWTNSYQM